MGVSFVMRIVRPRPDGTLEKIEDERAYFSRPHHYLEELFGEWVPGIAEHLKILIREQASFPWYRNRLPGYYRDGTQEPTVSDCWDPSEVLASLDAVARTLRTWEPHFPYFYFLEKEDPSEELTDVFVFHDGQAFRIFSWWDECEAILEEPSEEEEEDVWDGELQVSVQVKIDLRGLQEFPCRDRIVHQIKGGKRRDEMGREISLRIHKVSCYERFRADLEHMSGLCRRAIDLKSLVITCLA